MKSRPVKIPKIKEIKSVGNNHTDKGSATAGAVLPVWKSEKALGRVNSLVYYLQECSCCLGFLLKKGG